MSTLTKVSRRTVLNAGMIAGGGLVLGCVLPSRKAAGATAQSAQGASLNLFVSIDSTGAVSILAPRPECGTGVKTSLPMCVAEELGVDWKSIKVVMSKADGGMRQYGGQGIGGSNSIRGSFSAMRWAGATAALMLRQAAAQKWGIGVEQCRIENGSVLGGNSGQRVTFGELAAIAAKLPVPERSTVTLKKPSEFKILGKPTKQVDTPAIVAGKAVFALDCRPKGAKVAVVARPVPFGGSVKSFDDSEAKKVSGVTHVIQLGSGVAVVGNNTYAAMKGRDALKIQWDQGPNASLNTEELNKRFKAAVQPFPDMPAGSAAIEAVYELPFLSHAPLEPMNASADVRADSAEIWAPTQSPEGALSQAAQQLGLSPDKVTFHLPLMGGAFGRRFSSEYISEAIAISKQIGSPVQVLWSRDDDLRHDFYRPMTYHAMKGAVNGNSIVAYYHQALRAGGGGRGGANWGRGQVGYGIANTGSINGGISSSVPTGPWRSVDATFMGYVTECFFDELCTAAKLDPYQARMDLLQNGTLKECVRLAAEKAGWGKPLPAGWGRGIACYSSFGSSVAHVAEVEVKNGVPKVHRIVSAVDCGLVVNPLGAKSQIEGAVMDGIATMFYSQITIDGGGVYEQTFGEFGWARIDDAPVFETYFVERPDASPSGLGEPGFPPAGPAIANAVFAACGKRVRKLPIGGKIA